MLDAGNRKALAHQIQHGWTRLIAPHPRAAVNPDHQRQRFFGRLFGQEQIQNLIAVAVLDVGNVALRLDSGRERGRPAKAEFPRAAATGGIGWSIRGGGCLRHRAGRDQERHNGQRELFHFGGIFTITF